MYEGGRFSGRRVGFQDMETNSRDRISRPILVKFDLLRPCRELQVINDRGCHCDLKILTLFWQNGKLEDLLHPSLENISYQAALNVSFVNKVMSAKKLVKSKSGLRMIPTEGDGSPFHMHEPIWSLDAEVRDCSACGIGFSFFVRKHHCRRCGRIFCAQCCKRKLNLNRMHFVDPVLHCPTCSKLTLEESHFFETCLRVLTSGAFLAVSSDNESSESSYITKLSSDHASIVFQAEYLYNLSPVPINSIVQAVPVSDTNDCVVTYAIEKYRMSLRFSPGPGPHRQQAILWLEAFLTGTRMIGKDHAKEIE